MPIYEYECRKCCLRFELKKQFGEDGAASCPSCQAEARRLFSAVPIIFKGSGFYVTDSKKNQPSDEVKKDEKKVDAGKKSESN